MINFHDPVIIAKEHEETQRFWNIVDGIFIWEFVTTLNYEWSVIRGGRPYRWTIWIYSLTRVATLAAVALNLYSNSLTTVINCQVIVNLQFILGYLALAAASLLIVLRIIAIWDRNRIIVVFATSIWGTNVAFLIQGALRLRSSWNEEMSLCACQLDSVRLSTIVAFVTDVALLSIMFFGLRRLRRHGGLMGLGCLLWNQGVVWLLVAVVAELTPMVFILLNLNGSMNIMFQIPWLITMSIAATRMYRSLTDFFSSDVHGSSQKILPTGGRTMLGAKRISTAPVFLTGVQVAMHTTHEQHSTPKANRFGSNISGQPHEKPREPIADIVNDHDMGGGKGKCVV